MTAARSRARSIAAAFALFATPWLPAAWPAVAGTEEFSTFDVEAQEDDDESVIDHALTRQPRLWDAEWQRSPQALRTAQGCLTSGQWFIDTELKLRAPLGAHARFGLDLHDSESDVAKYSYTDFSFRFPTHFGTPGAMFRPFQDKSRQDFGITWEAGSDSSAYEVRAAFTLEDLFNNLWAFRQTRVGNASDSEPYERHPFEPALAFATRHHHWRAEVAGRYLTPSRKRVIDFTRPGATRSRTLWGTLATASVAAEAVGCVFEAEGRTQQARGTDRPAAAATAENATLERAWSSEFVVRRAFHPKVTAELRWLYEERSAGTFAPLGPGAFGAVDRVLTLETVMTLTPTLALRLGGLHDRITVGHAGITRRAGYGTRVESRAYVGLLARFGRVSVSGVEGIELDPEPYEVWGWHDKGFLHLQTTF